MRTNYTLPKTIEETESSIPKNIEGTLIQKVVLNYLRWTGLPRDGLSKGSGCDSA
jgi:hypothetical protein